jgi:hypothetical protein
LDALRRVAPETSRWTDSSEVEMKRVLFLAVLTVSIVEFTMERDRMYLLFTAVALLALIYSLFQQRGRIRATPRISGHTKQKEAGEIASEPTLRTRGSCVENSGLKASPITTTGCD